MRNKQWGQEVRNLKMSLNPNMKQLPPSVSMPVPVPVAQASASCQCHVSFSVRGSRSSAKPSEGMDSSEVFKFFEFLFCYLQLTEVVSVSITSSRCPLTLSLPDVRAKPDSAELQC